MLYRVKEKSTNILSLQLLSVYSVSSPGIVTLVKLVAVVPPVIFGTGLMFIMI